MDGICSAHAMVARAKPNVALPEFLLFLMMSDKFMNRAVDISVGSLSPTINWTTLKLEEFDLPPLDQQRRIAEILWAVDEVACAEFKMTSAIDGLLNSLRTRLGKEDSLGNGLRLIEDFRPPTGWQIVHGKELVSAPITRGYTPTGSMNTETAKIPFIKVYNLRFDGSFDFTKDPTFIESAVHEGELLRSQTLPGDVLINLTGPPMGKISVVPDTYPVWNINQAIARYRIDDSLLRDYFTIYLQSHWAQTWFDMRAKKTSGQKNITLQLAQDLPVPLPPKKAMESFVTSYRAVENAHRQLRVHSQANSTLMASISNSVFV
jgi:restriction endonuclease S subunit